MTTVMRASPAANLPWFLLLAVACKLIWMGSLQWYGSLPSQADSVCFKQPAYMRLFTPDFSIPSYAGRAEHTDKFNSYPAVLYVLLNYAVFRVVGFGLYVSIGVDLAVHLAFCLLGAVALWRLTGAQLPAVVFLVCSSQWLLSSGRPEELGMLLVLVSLLMLSQPRWGLGAAIVGLGLAGATSPGAGVVGTALLIAYDGFRRGFDSIFWQRAAALFILPAVVAIGAYTLYVWPYPLEAWQQDRTMRSTGFYATRSIWQLAASNRWWALSLAMQSGGALLVAAYARGRKLESSPHPCAQRAIVSAAAVAIVVGLALNVLARRLEYDYRHVLALSSAILAIGTTYWLRPSGNYAGAAWLLALAAVLASLPPQRDLVRHTLAPLACGAGAVSFDDARRLVAEVVPPDVTVGGDGPVWALIDDGRPFLLTRTIHPEHWPDYVISGTWSRQPVFFKSHSMSAKLAADYEEITPIMRPQDGCWLNLMGFKIPIAAGRCDWHVRIWKKRSL